MKPVVEINDYAYQYPGRTDWALSHLSLTVQPGECICFTGPSGCGKTTLFLALKGLLKSGREQGLMQAGNGNGHRSTGLVFQNAEHQLLCTTVADEVAFGPLNFGFSPREIETAVKKSLEMVALTGFENRNVEALSAGQTHRLAIASVLSTDPEMLFLDEPTAQLDGPGKERLTALLREMKSSGHTLLIADHELSPFESLADRFVFMDRGRIMRIDRELPKEFTLFPPRYPQKMPAAEKKNRPPIISLKGVFLSGNNGRPLFDNLNLRVLPGRRVFIHGQNGVGKSTLLKCMVGVLRPESGSVKVAGLDRPALDRLLGKIGFLFQNPERQLFEDTVWDEVGFSLKRLGLSKKTVSARIADALEIFEVSHLKDHSPLTLSFGEQHRVALASVMAPQPEILMLDEPFAGLDFNRRKHILKILSRLCETRGTTVVIASHEFLPDESWADETLILKEGRIEKSQEN
ncbi:MAG: energy-coupling factor ABC transporter ATP-binding protein [Deltaproteobacteria bacterium]|nr:energy-coupling factor ABC transporter ATP-binding protein [Deltaproteobacteria bacterium]